MTTLKRATLIMAAVLTVAGGFALNVPAAESTTEDGAPLANLHERIREKLDLTDDQVAQIRIQIQSETDNVTSLLKRLHDAHTQLRAAIQKPDATEASVRAAAGQLSTVESDLAVERLKLWGKVRPILTNEQQVKLAALAAGVDQFIERIIDASIPTYRSK